MLNWIWRKLVRLYENHIDESSMLSVYCSCGACGDTWGCGCDRQCDGRIRCLYPHIYKESKKFSQL